MFRCRQKSDTKTQFLLELARAVVATLATPRSNDPPPVLEIGTRARPMADSFARLKSSIGDRYSLERELGRGGMATVYLARDLRTCVPTRAFRI